MIQVDRPTIIQIFGSLMNKPNLFSDVDKYQLDVTDFSTQLDKFVFGAIYNLYVDGAEAIHTVDIDNYLKSNISAKKLIETENGIQFLQDCETHADPRNFYHYYNKLKKVNLLRDLQKSGRDISHIYTEDVFDEHYTEIMERFEKMTATDIINNLKSEVANLENKYVLNSVVEESKAVDGIKNLIEELKKKPEIGVKLQGDIYNTITRGGRKGKLYIRSAGTSVGKTRNMVGDACNIAYPIRFEPKYNKWIATGSCEKVLYIMTEQDPAEIQTMILAYLTGYNEDMFLYGTYNEAHMDRIMKAINIMETYKDNMLFARIPDPCASVIKNLFRRYNLQYGVENFFYDYIFSSPAMLAEYRDLKLREDVCLRLLTTTLKNLAIELNSFVSTSTQISNDDDPKGGFRDYRNIRGSKSIADLADFGCIMSRPTTDELKMIEGFHKQFTFSPNLVTDVYKNRRGRWTTVRIWSLVDLGTCRKYDLFVTTADMKPIEDFQIVEFISKKTEEMERLEDFYNDGVVDDAMAESLLDMIDEVTPASVSDSIEEAFGNAKERKERLKNMDWGDYI
jgi:replicative DNA helicase